MSTIDCLKTPRLQNVISGYNTSVVCENNSILGRPNNKPSKPMSNHSFDATTTVPPAVITSTSTSFQNARNSVDSKARNATKSTTDNSAGVGDNTYNIFSKTTAIKTVGFHRKSPCLTMTPHPLRFIRKVCFSTAFLSFIFVLHFNTGLRQNESKDLMRLSFLSPPASEVQHRKSLFSKHDSTYEKGTSRLPPPFRVVGQTNFSSNALSGRSSSLHNDNYPAFNCTTSKCQPNFTICVYETAVDRFISGALLSSGIWEPYITAAFQNALGKHPDATVIDIGANIGYYSLMASSRNHDVIAIEPYGENQRRLLAGTVRTKRQHIGAGQVLLLGNAMSDGHRFVSLSRSDDNQGGLRVLEEGCNTPKKSILGFLKKICNLRKDNTADTTGYNSEKHPVAVPCDIPTLTLDDLLLVTNTHKAIIKVDVEGYECRAMGQVTQFLTSIQVPYIFMEWRLMRERQRDRDTTCPTHVIRRLSSTLFNLGYVPHEVRSGIRLNPYSAPNWRVGDVYWRKKEYGLLVPSM